MTFLVCGVDEVGRGALAGPLIAVAAVFKSEKDGRIIIPASPVCPRSDMLDYPVQPGIRLKFWETENSPIEGVNDSKALSAKKRREVFQRILRSNHVVDFGIGQVEVEEIDKLGIDWANALAFQRAMFDLNLSPNYTLIDGDSRVMGWDYKSQRNEPKADGKWWPVGAASILAKVIRDSYMAELSQDHPVYGWEKNSGYGSDEHRCALIDFGPTTLHREKFIRNIRGVEKDECR